MASRCCSLALCVLGALATPAKGSSFLGRAAEQLAARPLLEELEARLGGAARAAAEGRVRRLEEALRPTFLALPKDLDGGLRPEAVRYALHRLFVERHGWLVRGLEAAGEAWNGSSPAAVFKGRASDDVHALFEERLGSHSFSLHHVAVLAATLEGLVHAETLERLRAAYRLVGLSRSEGGAADEELVERAIDVYMLMYVLGANHSTATPQWLAKQQGAISEIYPSWPETRAWMREVRQEVLQSGGAAAATSFNTTVRVMEAVADRYGRWQDRECRDLKGSLLKLEERGTGRVPLDSFYGSALAGAWQFSESTAYLRQLGALDEADPKRPSVVIPNYINAPSNCVASSTFYSVCCIDECEALQGHLEVHIAAPDASPGRIAGLVAALPSATVRAPRELPAALVQRLQEIAAHHAGTVPLHGRLFAQWLHHAFPRECPYPHLSGTTKPLTPEEWMEQTGERTSASEEEMRWHLEEARQGPSAARLPASGEADAAGDLPWSMEEELFVSRPRAQEPIVETRWMVGRAVALVPALVSMTVLVVRALQVGQDPLAAAPSQKHFV